MYCMYCGAQISPEDEACSSCGKSLPQSPVGAHDKTSTSSVSLRKNKKHKRAHAKSSRAHHASQAAQPVSQEEVRKQAEEAQRILESHKLYTQHKQQVGRVRAHDDEDLFSDIDGVDASDHLSILHDLPPIYRTDAQGGIVTPFGAASDVLPSWSDVGQGANVLTGATGKLPRIEDYSPERYTSDQRREAPKTYVASNVVDKRWSSHKLAKLTLISLCVAGSIGGLAYAGSQGFTFGIFAPKDAPAPIEAPAEKPEEAPVQNVDLSPEAVFASLNKSYESMPAYSDRIGEQVDEFNSWFQYSDVEKRKAAAQVCSDLQKEIEDEKNSFDEDMLKRKVEAGHAYYDQKLALDRLYDDLIARLAVLNKSWEISLASSNPAKETKEILAPIAAGDGSRALEQFNKNYPGAKPKEV